MMAVCRFIVGLLDQFERVMRRFCKDSDAQVWLVNYKLDLEYQ